MFAAAVRRKLRARHFLIGDFGPESIPHSHPYLVEAVCRNPGLDSHGFSTDIALLEEHLEKVLEAIDDVLLNDLDFFCRQQPSLENLCVYIQKDLTDRLKQAGAHLPEQIEIKIWESDDAWASYTHPV